MTDQPELTFPTFGRPDIERNVKASADAVRDNLIEIEGILESQELSSDLVQSTQIVLAEVFNNVVEHSFEESPKPPFSVRLWLSELGIWCSLEDDGVEMPGGVLPEGSSRAVSVDPVDNIPEGGFGWMIIRSIVSQLAYERENGRNHLQFLIPNAETA